jgi:hypothetical protein
MHPSGQSGLGKGPPNSQPRHCRADVPLQPSPCKNKNALELVSEGVHAFDSA